MVHLFFMKEVITIKRCINIAMIMVLVVGLFTSSLIINPGKANAISIVGSNAVKQAVIATWEKAGIVYPTKKAKDRAFDTWNMKVYQKWEEDERLGRNADLWADYNAIIQSMDSNVVKYPVAESGSTSRMLLDASFVGMAIGIGIDVANSMEKRAVDMHNEYFWTTQMQNEYDDLDYSVTLGFTTVTEWYPDLNGYPAYLVKLQAPDGSVLPLHAGSMIQGDPLISTNVSSYVYDSVEKAWQLVLTITTMSGGKYYTNSYNYTYHGTVVQPSNVPPGVIPYTTKPLPEYLPQTNPIPEIAPLIGTNVDDISTILPSLTPVQPLEVVVPNGDELWEDNLNIPGIEIIPGINPDPDPDPDPGTDPGKDKPIIPTPDTDNPPVPDIDPPPQEVPEYPGKTETTETPGLFEKLWEWLKAILDALFKILNAILALPFVLLNMLWDFLWDLIKAVFVPSEDFWDTNMNELKKVIWSDEIDEMVDDFTDMGNGSGGMFKDIVVSLMGVDGLTVIDADSINSILENIHKWVRGVVYPFLILFNINSLYKLIRGTSLVEATRGLAARQKGGE